MQEPLLAAKILVIEDEQDTLILTETILSTRGFQVLTARSGAQGMEKLAEAPDAVLLDVMMPEMSGLEVLEYIRSTPRLAHIPVILLTARQRDQDVLEGYQYGADYYITKPCTVDQIAYGLRMVLAAPPRARRHAAP